MASRFARFESSWLKCVVILQENVHKTCITDLNELKTATENGVARLGHVIAAAIRQWRRRQLQISDACFVHLLL